LLFTLPGGFGLRNLFSIVVRQREEKARIRTFFFSRFFLLSSALSLISRSFFFTLSRSFLFRACEREK
jgi:hypothetical protein